MIIFALFFVFVLVSVQNNMYSLEIRHPPPLSLFLLFFAVNYVLSFLWLVSMFANNGSSFADHYLLFDFPGQVELFFLHSNAKNVIMKLVKKLNLRVWLCLLLRYGIFLPSAGP